MPKHNETMRKQKGEKMREIGSEFWDVPQAENDNGIFPLSTQWFLSGRSALQAIIAELKGCRTVAVPSWCCDSMIKPFVDAGKEVHFFSVYFDESLIQDVSFDCDVLFLMDYFGYTGKHPDLSGYNGVVIRDVTHSIFSTTYSDADYYFGSLRKWCGVWTGGYVWTRNGQPLSIGMNTDAHGYIELRKKAMQLKSEYINGHGIDKLYLGIFNEAEEVLEDVGIMPAVERDVKAAMKLDVEYIKTCRRRNAEILRRAFSDWLVFREMKEEDCPMFVPVLVPDGKRNELRSHLIKNEIYCPIHWPVSECHMDVYHELSGRTETIYANELSLVCDQRYTEDDMNRMVEVIQEFWKER